MWGGSGAGEDGLPTNEHWGVKAERCEQWRQEREAVAAVGHFEMVKASRSELRITITDGDGGDGINRGGAELTVVGGVACRAQVVIWEEDRRSRGQGLVRAALGGRGGMKWITHKEKQRKTGRKPPCAGM